MQPCITLSFPLTSNPRCLDSFVPSSGCRICEVDLIDPLVSLHGLVHVFQLHLVVRQIVSVPLGDAEPCLQAIEEFFPRQTSTSQKMDHRRHCTQSKLAFVKPKSEIVWFCAVSILGNS